MYAIRNFFRSYITTQHSINYVLFGIKRMEIHNAVQMLSNFKKINELNLAIQCLDITEHGITPIIRIITGNNEVTWSKYEECIICQHKTKYIIKHFLNNECKFIITEPNQQHINEWCKEHNNHPLPTLH